MQIKEPHELAALTDIEDGSLGSIDMTEVLDRIPAAKALPTMRAVASKLRDRATLELSVTDFDAVCDAYKNGTGDPEDALCRGGLNAAIYNRKKVHELLAMAGFEILGGASGRLALTDPSGRIAIRAEKRERKAPAIPMTDVHAVISLPRIAWTDTYGKIVEAVAQLKPKFTKSTGVFWGQCLERMMAQVVKSEDTKYILTIDYDSIFDAEDVVRLWQIMESNPDIAALCPLQIGRDRDAVLCHFVDAEGKTRSEISSEEMFADALEIKNGHFGLTLIRTAALRDIPHPWFLGIPAPDGTWNEGRIDDDIYFWHKLRSLGKRVCVTPKVRLGHLQLIVTWPKDDLSCVHQYLNKYHEAGRPPECMTY